MQKDRVWTLQAMKWPVVGPNMVYTNGAICLDLCGFRHHLGFGSACSRSNSGASHHCNSPAGQLAEVPCRSLGIVAVRMMCCRVRRSGTLILDDVGDPWLHTVVVDSMIRVGLKA